MFFNILNISVRSIKLDDLLKLLCKGVLITPNVDHLVKLQKDKEFYNVYKKADWVICDSNFVNLAAKILGTSLLEVIPGSSLLPAYYNYHKNNRNIQIFLLGAKEGVALKAQKNINQKVGWDIVSGAFSPSFGFENNEIECNQIIKIINESKCNVLVVGVGAPKQEKWIMKYKEKLPNIDLFMALGATIDFEAGNIKRAPVLFQKLYLEWFYRFLVEPRRLWRRYFIEDPLFFWYIFKQKTGIYKNPFE
ncbi:WecB/TagA/CpsF family glycosyltransferase [Flavobacterium sp. LC2016-01]|uniref:WecB/TagA/CpsF family glycosyltransferase n=1 Tax=Flavobacterium sp. LC2016-01 TaxID=2675876 RepID=UPI0012BADADA|nr:WecB/TagA/CpsF family glycosyltransferase [Flavobacterium sp. LC2016-01]MTH18077.1 WecB/TagA/CpsF family glycosyltransferase [Flavobacterium sp. LC2016-01]